MIPPILFTVSSMPMAVKLANAAMARAALLVMFTTKA